MESVSPQVEDGFTRIANTLFEALCAADCPSSVLRITMAVIRETYGYNQTTARIPTHRLATIMACSERRVRQVLDEAVAWGMVVREGREIGPQKHFSRWAKPEGPPSEKRKVPLPAFFKGAEGPSSEKRKEDLPKPAEPLVLKSEGPPSEKSEGPPSAKGKDKKDRTSTPSSGLAKIGEPDDEKAEETRRQKAKTDAIQEVWNAFGFDGNPCRDTFKKLIKEGSALDGNVAVCRDYAEYVRFGKVPLDRDSTEDAFFWKKISKALCCPDGVGWRRDLERLRGGSAPSPEKQSWRGWPSRLREPDLRFKPTADELEAMIRSPDFEDFPLDRFMSAQMADRIRDARKALPE